MDIRTPLNPLFLALLFLCALQPLRASAADQALFGRLDELCRQAKADARGPQRDLFWSNLLQCWQMENREDREDTLARLDEHLSGLCRDIAARCAAAPDGDRVKRMALYSDSLQCQSRGQVCGAGNSAALSGQERFRRIRATDPEAQRYYRSCRQGALDTQAAKEEWNRAVARSGASAARKEAVQEYARAIGEFINAMLTADRLLGPAATRAMTIYGAPFLLMMHTSTTMPDSRELEMYKVAIGNWRNQCELLVKAVARVDASFAHQDYPWLNDIRRRADEAMRLQ